MELQILNAALDLFASDGFEGTSMQSIAKEAGVSKGNLYNYFESKQELLKGVLLHGLDQLSEVMEASSLELLTEEAFEGAIRVNFELIRSNKVFWKLYYNLFAQPKVQVLFSEIFNPFLEQYLEIFELYFENKGDKNPKTTALLLGSTLDGVSLGFLMMGDAYPLDDIVDQIIMKFK
ncbi:MAG: TetR/AcrR family transcriptional regulator [Flavobacteriaceae bacterium]|nr:TetR/AcrR family transcriptional regulator [Flavobacteriaceae bacterium]